MADLDLARRAVACPGWAWRPGMLARPDPNRTVTPELAWSDRFRVLGDGEVGGPCGAPEGWLPDLDDAATKGAVLGLVREAWGSPAAQATPVTERRLPAGSVSWTDCVWVVLGWRVAVYDAADHVFGSLRAPYPTEAAALVAALEAAGRRT